MTIKQAIAVEVDAVLTDECARHGEAFARLIVEVSLSDQGDVVVDQVVCLLGSLFNLVGLGSLKDAKSTLYASLEGHRRSIRRKAGMGVHTPSGARFRSRSAFVNWKPLADSMLVASG